MESKEYTDKVCRDCKERIEYLCDFPGPRCLKCHEKRFDREVNANGGVLPRPDFKAAVKN